ncbi:MAG: 23S rRNA (guanosine(2251)-2'-O)-methyltransferase RlmB [Janthinobacterium lividum]
MKKFIKSFKHSSSPIQKEGRFWIYGFHAVQAALQNPRRQCHCLLYLSDDGFKNLKIDSSKGSIEITKVDRERFQQLFSPEAVHQGLALQISSLPEKSLEDILENTDSQFIIATLDQITDPHNLGAIARSAAAFGIQALLTPERHTPLLTSPVLYKAASGAMEHVSLVQVTNLARALQQLQQAQFWNMGFAEEGTQDLNQSDFKGRVNLILGAEGEGMRRLTREHCDHLIRLPTHSIFSTLNVSNAAAIAFYEAYRQQRKSS